MPLNLFCAPNFSSTSTTKWTNEKFNLLPSIPSQNINRGQIHSNRQAPSCPLVALRYVGLRVFGRIIWIITHTHTHIKAHEHKRTKVWVVAEKQLIRTLVNKEVFSQDTSDQWDPSSLSDRLAQLHLLSGLSLANYCPHVAWGSWAATENNRDNCNKGGKCDAVVAESSDSRNNERLCLSLTQTACAKASVQCPSVFR